MAKQIFDKLWGDQQEAVLKACQMIESCLHSTTTQVSKEQENFHHIKKLEQRILNLAQMRADGELTKEQYKQLYTQTAKELKFLQQRQSNSEDSHDRKIPTSRTSWT